MNKHRMYLVIGLILSFWLPVMAHTALGEQPVAAETKSVDELVALCQKAKTEFRPLTQEDLKLARTELAEAAARLDARLKPDGPNGDDWQKFLHWELMQNELRKAGPMDPKTLNDVCDRFASGNEGLGLIWFVDVRTSLWRLLKTTEAIDNPRTKTTYESILDNLSNNLKSFAAKPTTENTLGISESIRWLEIRRQAPELVEAVARRFNRPNLYGDASADFIAAASAENVDDNTQICDNILGTEISGTGHTVGRTTAKPSPDPGLGVIDAMLFATTYSTTVGVHGPVCIYSNGTTRIGACKRIWVDENGVFSCPAVSNAVTETCISDIQAKKQIIERMAWKRAGKQLPLAECIASQHAEQRVNKRVDDQAAETLDKAQKDYTDKVRRPLLDHKLFPDRVHFNTDENAVRVVLMQVGSSRLAAPSPPPEAVPADLALRVHESMVNNFALDALGGMTLNEENVDKAVVDTLGRLPEKMKRDETQPPWTITFATRQPISVTFADNGFKILIRGSKFINGDRSCDDMDISATYKFEKTATGFKAVRQGDIQISPPGRQQLSGTEVAIKELLSKRFGKILEPELAGEGFEFSGKLQKVGKMQPVDIQSRDGWLTIAWKRVAVEPKIN